MTVIYESGPRLNEVFPEEVNPVRVSATTDRDKEVVISSSTNSSDGDTGIVSVRSPRAQAAVNGENSVHIKSSATNVPVSNLHHCHFGIYTGCTRGHIGV